MTKNKKRLIRKNVGLKIKEIDDEQFIIRGVFSTDDEDRHGEVIDQKGWDIKEYMTNPVVLFAHDQWTPAVAQMIELGIDAKGRLAGAMKFAVEEFELAKTLFNLYKGGYMRAFSVGFMNTKEERITDDNDDETILLKENKLYELSCVNVPANAMALAGAKGINVNAIDEAIDKANEEKNKNKVVSLTDEAVEKISDSLYKKIQHNISTDTAKKIKKVETPKSQGGEKHKKRFATTKQINQAIRQLVKVKKEIKK